MRDYDGDERYRPIGAWGYFGYNILFSIPIVGQLILIIFALGGTGNVNVRSYARSFFCGTIIAIIIILIIFAMGGGFAFQEWLESLLN